MEYICPHCKTPIYDDDALLCHFCGESLGRASSGWLGRMKYAKAKGVFAVIAGVVLLAFILLMIR